MEYLHYYFIRADVSIRSNPSGVGIKSGVIERRDGCFFLAFIHLGEPVTAKRSARDTSFFYIVIVTSLAAQTFSRVVARIGN